MFERQRRIGVATSFALGPRQFDFRRQPQRHLLKAECEHLVAVAAATLPFRRGNTLTILLVWALSSGPGGEPTPRPYHRPLSSC